MLGIQRGDALRGFKFRFPGWLFLSFSEKGLLSGVSVRLRWRRSVLQASCPLQGLGAWMSRVVYPTSNPRSQRPLVIVACDFGGATSMR
eukprot:2961150-Pyramimonas_sp.AAC.1